MSTETGGRNVRRGNYPGGRCPGGIGPGVCPAFTPVTKWTLLTSKETKSSALPNVSVT